ncbi:MAG TPA: glycosyltransferase [Chlamydiales bacterium]|nr:glycosyltransferase [Chlamydiales bacterium]
MKFSVLLPTRNRLEFLIYAIESVRRQEYDRWEIIISDNYSEQDIKGYIDSLNEPRIKYSRTERFLSVTDNWNAALDRATGDYVIMLGDDDCLMKGYFNIVQKIVSEFSSPELIYSNAFLYAYPGVLPKYPEGHFKTMGNCGLWDRETPYLLSAKTIERLVNDAFNFKMTFAYNMQFATIHKNLIERMRVQGKFFHSPYPDFYAMPLLMDRAKTVVACPYPLVTVGISPKSHGYYHFNNREKDAALFLNNPVELKGQEELNDILLPGSVLNTTWLVSLHVAQKELSRPIAINYARYRRFQTLEFFQSISREEDRLQKVRAFIQKLKGREKWINGTYLFLLLAIRAVGGFNVSTFFFKVTRRLLTLHTRHPQRKWDKKYENILEGYEEFDPLAFR